MDGSRGPSDRHDNVAAWNPEHEGNKLILLFEGYMYGDTSVSEGMVVAAIHHFRTKQPIWVNPDWQKHVGEPLDHIPSHRSDELPLYIQIDRLNYRVEVETLTGTQIRYLATPPIGDEYDLWKVGVGRDDWVVRNDEVVNLRGGRFFTAPRYINAG